MRYVVIALCAALAACGEVEDTRPGRPVAHRQEAFKAILRAFEPMGVQLRENTFEPVSFMDHARALERIKDTPWEYFGEDTQYPPSKSLDRLWQERAGFDALQEDFQRSTGDLKAAAESRDEAGIRAAWAAVEKTCRDCHKAYRR
ncbi:MAG: cytochrome c [Betaproteobacteria bacterium]|nr:cytochrome c [Betaproteobacteria bacterium]